MKKVYLLLALPIVMMLASSSVSIKSSNGIAGYAGAPGGFGTCGACHAGGSASSSGLTITATPSFSNNEFRPDSSYMISISAFASGFTRFGFDCEILNTSGANAGVISPSLAAGVKTLSACGGRRDAAHTTPRQGTLVTWTFPWKAPSTGSVTIYAVVNAVNFNGSTSGDFPLSPASLSLSPFVAPVDTTIDTIIDKVAQIEEAMVKARLYPNPATVLVNLDYYLPAPAQLVFTVTDLHGRQVMTRSAAATAGRNTQSLDLRALPEGTYFVGVSDGRRTLTQKMLLVN